MNVGSIDDLTALADIAVTEELWFHVDGAFGATAVLSDRIRPLLAGMERADSLAFDFHKWLHVNYSAGCVLIRDAEAHSDSFADRPEYLHGATAGLASGGHWPLDCGPELSRGFMALKIWTQLKQFGTERLGGALAIRVNLTNHRTRNSDLDLLLAETLRLGAELSAKDGSG